jgi:hypothetical protein
VIALRELTAASVALSRRRIVLAREFRPVEEDGRAPGG